MKTTLLRQLLRRDMFYFSENFKLNAIRLSILNCSEFENIFYNKK